MRSAPHIALLCFALAGCGGTEPTDMPAAEPGPWVAQSLGTDAEFRDVFFLDDQRGWLVGGGHNIQGGIVGSTRDGGRTWEFRSGVARPSPRSHLFHLNAIQFIDEATGVIAADGGIILRTADGGEHWHQVHRESRVSAHLFDLHFVDRSHGWAIGGSILMRTTDRGATWYPCLSDNDASGFHASAIHFLDRREGWALGRHGQVFHTIDGGGIWSRIRDPAGSRLPTMSALVFVDRKLGWMVGERGLILHTPDGGHSWQRQPRGSAARLTDVHFADALNGWAVGYHAREGTSIVLHTTDGGATWTEQARVLGEDLRTLFFTSTGHGWAAGDRVRRLSQKLLRYEPGA